MEPFYARLNDELPRITGTAVFGPKTACLVHGVYTRQRILLCGLVLTICVQKRSGSQIASAHHVRRTVLGIEQSHGWSYGGAGHMVMQWHTG